MRRLRIGVAFAAVGLMGVACQTVGNQESTSGLADANFPNFRQFQRGADTRNIDGTGNNRANPRQHWGTTDSNLLRLTTVSYGDGRSTPAGAGRPSARAVSNAVCAQSGSIPNSQGVSDYIWQWGQFLDHDMDLSEGGSNGEPFPIEVPRGDPFFDPNNTGTQTIPFTRTDYRTRSGVREQFNSITSYIDASNVYGSTDDRADALRANDGTGKLKVSSGNLLPFNTTGEHNAPDNSARFFLAGDIRVNEQAGLIAIHTLFMREHNWLCDQIRAVDPSMSGDEVYQMARTIVGAEMQAITYNEFLPALIGRNTLGPYRNYNGSTNPGVANSFSTVAYRFGHSTLSPTIKRVGQPDLALRDAFFSPEVITQGGVDAILGGLATQVAQKVDTKVVDDIRNFLFGAPGAGGFDLASLNIQRGRDHGLPSYNQARRDYGLSPKSNFNQITSDRALARALQQTYGDVNNVDMWVGALAEDHQRGAMVGELIQTILKDQFERVREGDRFFYKHNLHRQWVEWVEAQTLGTIINRNTNQNVQSNVFIAR